jgi:RNA polymerase sigma factor (sigma-70 family)
MNPPTRNEIERLLGEEEWLARLARRLVGSGPDAEDLTQETLTRALRSGVVPTRPRPWLAVVARNLKLELHRSDARRRAREAAAAKPEASPDEAALERAGLRHRVLEEVLELPEPERTAVVLRYLEGRAYSEIATRQGVSVVAVRKRVSRGIERLRTRLDATEGGRGAWAGQLATAAALRTETTVPATLPFTALSLTAGLLAMNTQLKLVLGGTLLAALLVVLALRTGLLGPAAEPGSGPSIAPTSTALVGPDLGPEAATLAPDTSDPRARIAITSGAQAAVDDRVLSGLVLDHMGLPLPGARVSTISFARTDFDVLDTAYYDESRIVGRSTTDGNGRFQLEVDPHRPLNLTVSAQRHGRVALRVYGGEDLVVHMQLGATVEGRLTRASDGQPLEGIRVRAWASRQEMPDQFSDSSGTYRFEGLPPGFVTVAPEPEGLVGPGWNDLDLEAGQVVRRDFALEAGITVSGRVTDVASGEPIVGAEVGLGWTLEVSVRTDGEGRYILRGFGDPGVPDVNVQAAGYGQASHEFEGELPTEDTLLDFALSPARTAVGRILGPQGSPLKGIYVAGVGMHGQSGEWEGTRTGAGGAFELRSLVPAGRHQLFVQAKGYGTLIIDFPPDEVSRPLIDFGDLRLPAAACITGKVVDEENRPRPGVKVLLRGRHGGAGRFAPDGLPSLVHHITEPREALSDSRGRFHFTDLAPGTYTLAASVPRAPQEATARVTTVEGETLDGLLLTLPVGLTIRGQVVSDTGEACQGVIVGASPKGGGGPRASLRTDEQGRFEVVGLSDGDYVLHAAPWLYNPAHPQAPLLRRSITVAAGTDGLLIELPRAVRLKGVVHTGRGEVVPHIGIVIRASLTGEGLAGARTDEEGRFSALVPGGVLLDLETRALGEPRSPFLEPDDRSVTKTGVDPASGEVLLVVEGY